MFLTINSPFSVTVGVLVQTECTIIYASNCFNFRVLVGHDLLAPSSTCRWFQVGFFLLLLFSQFHTIIKISHSFNRRYREHVKDLSGLGRDLRRTVIIDNNPFSFVLQPLNGIPCVPFTGEHSEDQQV